MRAWWMLGLFVGGCYRVEDLPGLCEPLGDAASPSHAPLAEGPPSWLPGPKLPSPLASHAAAQLEGRPYVLGGSGGAMAVRDVRSLDEASGKWVTEPQLPGPRQGLAAAVGRGGRLFAIGGGLPLLDIVTSKEYISALPTVESFAPRGVWKTEPPLPGSRWGLAAVGQGEDVYALGGKEGKPPDLRIHGSLFALGPMDGTWRLVAEEVIKRSDHAAAFSSDGRIVPLDNSVGEAFDPLTGSSHPVPPLLEPRDQLAGVSAPDGRVYAIGGVYGSRSVESYAPDDAHWFPAPPLLVGRAHLAATLGSDGRIYAIGGLDVNGQPLASVEVFGPVTHVEPAVAAPGAVVHVLASNFAQSAEIVVSSEAGCVVARGRTDSAGTGDLSLRLPPTAGFYRLRTVDLRSRYPVTVVVEAR